MAKVRCAVAVPAADRRASSGNGLGLRVLALAAALVCAGPAFAASALAEALRHHRDAERLDVGRIAALYDEAILTEDGVNRTLGRLRVFANRTDRPPRELANTRLLIAHVLWRHGDPDAALAATDEALAALETADGLLLKGRLLDAKGNADAAAVWYQRAIAASDSEPEKEFLRLRLTMAQASDRNVDALARLAGEGDAAYRNRAAVALGILGHPAKALAIYQTAEGYGAPFRQHIRLAEWAIAAADWPRAQAEAWRAFDAAGPRANALYALAILVEAHRGGDALGDLLAAIDERMGNSAPDTAPDAVSRARDLARTRVDLLIETQRYDEAIGFYQAADQSVDIAARRRLVQLYEAAGRPADMVAEYRRLMRAEPHTVAWYGGLAGHHMNMAAEDEALSVWSALETANADRLDVLLEGGERMIEMGFVEPAVAMIERHMAGAGESAPALLFVFEARFARGRNDEALAALQRLEAILPPGDGAVRDLADAYERMNKPDRAVHLLEALRDAKGGLGYDERMRLAWLYSVANRKADALAAWRELWLDVKSAARRSLAEDQLMLLAAELNVLADVAVELEDKLHLGEADRNEMNLLVRIYTEVGDSLSATEIIDAYAAQSGTGEAERLRRLGQVYRMVADHDAYDRVLRQLVRVDAENELEHVQNIVLNMLAHDLAEDSDERFGEIQRWLARLRAFDEQSVSGEFEAGILSLGGFSDEAIASYRRALVEQPENSDNLLLMADLMKNAGRRDEAVALLQYAAEHAADDNAFVVAVDGIINMIGARTFDEELTPALQATFRWTHRVILERVTGRDGKFYLYRLLADIAQEIGDTEGEFLALENALSQAGLRRPAVLRELVTLATPNSGFGGFSTGGGDAERHLIHGRRLIGLRQALPPEVYIDLGGVLLGRGDLAGAGRAFDRIDDITGLIDVDKTKADLLHDAGHAQQALVHYNRALNVNRDNLSLLARTAMLREAQGQDDVANRLYWRGLDAVLRAQAITKPAVRPGAGRSPMAMLGLGPDTSVTREYRNYFECLAQGFLITWPEDRANAHERLQPLYVLIDDAAAAVAQERPQPANDEPPPLAEFPRLYRATEFARRVAQRAGGDIGQSLEDHIDAALANFQANEQAPAAAPETPLLRRQLALAEQGDDFGLVVRLAKLLGDEATLEERFAARIAAGKVREGLAYAWHLLTPPAFERLARSVLPTLRDDEAGLLSLIGESTDLVLEMEERLGVDVVSADVLPTLLTSRAAQTLASSPRAYRSAEGFWRYAQAKLDLDGQVAFMARTAAGPANRSLDMQLGEMFTDLVAKPLNADQQAAVLEAANTMLAKMDDTTSPFGRMNVAAMFLATPHPDSRPALYELAASWQRRASLPLENMAATIRELHEGTPDVGFRALLRLTQAGLWRAGYYFGPQEGLDARFAGERERFFDRLRSGEAVDAEIARSVYDMEFPGFDAPTREQAALLRDLVAAFPDDSRYRDELAHVLLQLDERGAAEQALVAFVERDKRAEFARAGLYFHYLEEGRYGAALALATDGGTDLRDPTVIDDLVRKAQAPNRGQWGSGLRIFQHLYPKPIGRGYSFWSKPVERGIGQLRALAAPSTNDAASETAQETQADALPKVLRGVWRGALLPGDDSSPRFLGPAATTQLLATRLADDGDGFVVYYPGAGGVRIGDILDADSDAAEDALLFDALAQLPESAAELDLYTRALAPPARRTAGKLYQFLADALAAGETGEQLARELDSALREDRIGEHEFAVWMMLRENQEAALSPSLAPALHEAFAARFAQIDEPTVLELLLAARLHAKSDAKQEAATYYSAVAARLNHHDEFADAARSFSLSDNDLIDCATLIAEVAKRLPEAAAEWARDVLALFRPLVAHPTTDAYFHALALKGFGEVLPPAEAIQAAAGLVAETPPLTPPLKPHDAHRAIELLRLQAKAGETEAALATLRTVVAAPAPVADEELRNRPMAAYRLPALYGLSSAREDVGALATLMTERERVFPSSGPDAWPGARQWTQTAADALLRWFDETEDETARTRIADALLLCALQLQQGGEADAARQVVTALAEQTTGAKSEADPTTLRNIALLTLHSGQPLPPAMAEQVLAQGTLTAAQEVALLQALVDAGEPEAALQMGRLADQGNSAPLLRALLPLAEERGDAAYAADLTARLTTTENARRRLGVDPTG